MVLAKQGDPEERGGQNKKKGAYCLWLSLSPPHCLLVNHLLTDCRPSKAHITVSVYGCGFFLLGFKIENKNMQKDYKHFPRTLIRNKMSHKRNHS